MKHKIFEITIMEKIGLHILKLAFLLISINVFSQNSSSVTNGTITKKIISQYFKNKRTIKILLPEKYDANKNYPVIYTLDGFELFPIASSYVNFLTKYDVIPNCIIVGIYHNNRNYETMPNYGSDIRIPVTEFLEGSGNLKSHLLEEVVPMIEKQYSVSGFNVIIGHSNTATFVNEIISKNENNFNGFIAITPDLLKKQTDYLEKHLSEKQLKQTYYFVSSGLKDDKYRLESGIMLDTIFHNSKNTNFKGLHKIYSAGHLDLVPKSLNDALMFIFSDYKNYDDFNDKVLNSKFSISNYIDQKSILNNKIYGINYKLNEEDFYYLLNLVLEKKDRKLFEQIFEVGEKNKFFNKDDKYASKAQYYEEIKLYDEALKNWKLQIEKGFYKNTFYFERPFILLTKKLKRQKEAIVFLEKAIKKYPEGKLIFNYLIAQTSLKYSLKKNKGIKAIDYCINRFKENNKFSLKDALEIKSNINKN
ncbi:alpha/beta hydrolase-fold protein [uncultured Polaribacter sp.]|uniref:alpha/beta hydrolase n=1 Tax=uncultured Polaribacter sp. TaxID=174711 RepID=UPI0026365B19|nr:alpha/beta hydrolase-fold protein [uncultured Polaribacter sp.]